MIFRLFIIIVQDTDLDRPSPIEHLNEAKIVTINVSINRT